MEKFVIKWKRRFLWHKRTVVGFTKMDGDRFALHFEDGSLLEIPRWSECHCELGADLFRVRKRKMEQEAGMKILVANDP